jgi:nucleotide-binding universal stress UspA family protein
VTRRQRILAGFDGSAESRDALHLARALAQIRGGRLEVAAVLLHHPLEPRAAADSDDAAAYFDRVFSEARRELPGVPISRWERQASALSAARALNDLAEEEDFDLIVVGSTHRGAVGTVMPGSLGARLVRAAPCPVAIAPRGFAGRERFRRGVVGIAHRAHEEAELALEWARKLAVELDAKLRVITILNPPSSRWLGGRRVGTTATRPLLQSVLESAGANELEVEPVVEEGEPGAVLARHGVELDLLVLGSRGDGLLRQSLRPGVAAGLTRALPCPLVVVPSGIADRTNESELLATSAVGNGPHPS